MLTDQEPSVDFLIVADRAEVCNGRLSLLGGGWQSVTINPALPVAVSVAAGVTVPWHATNRDHHLRLSLQNSDGQEMAVLSLPFRVGRPADIEEGASQLVLLSWNLMQMFPFAGRYVVVSTLGAHEKRTSFRILLLAQPSQQHPGS